MVEGPRCDQKCFLVVSRKLSESSRMASLGHNTHTHTHPEVLEKHFWKNWKFSYLQVPPSTLVLEIEFLQVPWRMGK